jgi:hypothetical protein
METTLSPYGEHSPPTRGPATNPAPRDDVLFAILTAVAVAVVALGFGLEFVGAPPPHARPRTHLVVAHAAVFATWIMLFGVQTVLIATNRTRLHQRLGVGAAVLAVIMLVLGYATAIHAARTGYAPIPGVDPLAFLITPLGDLIVFATFVSAGLYWRRTGDVHKRLMWLGTAMLTFPAVARIPHVRGKAPLVWGVFLTILLIAPVYERLVRGRVHRVSAWGGAAVFLSLLVRQMIGHTGRWHLVAAWLIR